MAKCRLCGGMSHVRILEIASAPRSVERLLRSEALADDVAQCLQVYQCGACGLVQLQQAMEIGFYDSYEMATSFSPRFNAYLSDLAEIFCSVCEIQSGRIVEIGCGDGTFMEHLAARGFDVTGVEPSRPFRDAARSKGHTVFSTYVGGETPVLGAPYDAFATRQVLEHVFDILDFLRGIHSLVRPGAPGLIEVPNLDKSVSNGRFYDFFPDHVNYFSAQTLRRALDICGFDVLEIRPTIDSEFITAFVRRTMPTDFTLIRSAVQSVRVSLEALLDDHRRSGRRLTVWGSGGKGVTVLSITGAEGIEYVVDADPRKQGHFMPVSHLKVYPPEKLMVDPVDTVLITALAHLDEIVTQLRESLEFKGRIASLGTHIQYIDRHSPDDIQIRGRRTTDPPPWELRTLRSPPMRRLWRADQVRNAIWQSIPPSRRTSPIVFTSPLISSAYAGTGLGRRSSIKLKIFWNKLLGTATSANWNVTYRP